MSSSLAEQLKRLAVPQTNQLQRDKKRPSLLFDPKEAAGLRRETVYQIGLDGLEELIARNPIFEQYRNNLFDLSSRTFERSMEDVEGNKKLDRIIRKFLLQLSPYFLLNSTHKALEWLINRYSIQEYNREDLLMLVLPYHESNIFVRVIQLMKFNETNDSWYFLKSLQKTGVHLPKRSLLSHAASNPGFIRFVAKFIAKLVEVHNNPGHLTIAFNFYCGVFIGAIEFSKDIDEAQLAQILPAVLKGLSSDIADYVAASYIIVARLVAKTTLVEELLDKFVQKLSESPVASLRVEMVLTLLVIYQSQVDYKRMPEAASRNFVEKQWLPKVFQELSESECCIWPCLEALVRSCFGLGVRAEEEDGDARQFVGKVLATLKFDEHFVTVFLGALLDAADSPKKLQPHVEKWLVDVLETVERQYPDQFDREVYKILSLTKTNECSHRKKSLRKILKGTMALQTKFDIFHKLYHGNAQIRNQAIVYLSENFKELRERDREMIRNSIVDRLNDDDVAVINETLLLVEKTPLLDKSTLNAVLRKLLEKFDNNLEVSTKVALMLASNSQPDDWESFLSLFPLLLPSTPNELSRAKAVYDTYFCKKSPILNVAPVKKITAEKFCSSIFAALNSTAKLTEQLLRLLEDNVETRSTFQKLVALIILPHVIPENTTVETNLKVVKTVQKLYEGSEHRFEKDCSLQGYLATAKNGVFPTDCFLNSVKLVVEKNKKPIATNLGLVDFTKDSEFSSFFNTLADILINTKTRGSTDYVNHFLRYFCTNIKSRTEFLLNLMLSNCNSFNAKFDRNCIKLIQKLVLESKDSGTLLKMDEAFLAFILSLLSHTSEVVRKITTEILEHLHKTLNQSDRLEYLIAELLQQKEEIISDDTQIPLVLYNILSKFPQLEQSFLKYATNPGYPSYLKARMFILLSHLDSFKVFETVATVPLEIIKKDTTQLTEPESIILTQTLNRIGAHLADSIVLESNVWKFIECAMKKDTLKLSNDETCTVLTLKQIDSDFFAKLSQELQSSLLDLIVEISTTSQNPGVLPAASYIFKHLDLDANILSEHFAGMRDVHSPKLDPNKLKRRISVVPTIDILDTLTWKKGVSVLEFIQDKKKIRNAEALLPLLFDVLKKCLDFDEQTALEYTKQLILSSILHVCTKFSGVNASEQVFNIELIVQCIRASQNPQTHHHALLVLAYSAELIPSQVLHHIMAIFTFIGSSVLRYDDAYSYQIITKIIDTVIPIIVKDQKQQTVTKVFRVFVDAILDIPEHRRLPLYKQLLSKFDLGENLFVFLLLIFESHVTHSGTPSNQNTSNDEVMKRIQIATSFFLTFPVDIVLATCKHLLSFLQNLPEDLDNFNEPLAYGIKCHTAKQFRHYKYIVVTFTANFLGAKEFVEQVATLSDEAILSLEQLYKDLLVGILTYIQKTSKISEKNSQTPQARYWKMLLHHSYDILDSINGLLTAQMLLLVVRSLLSYNLTTVKRRALELFNAKLHSESSFFADCTKQELFGVVAPVLKIIKGIQESDFEADQEVLLQTALLSLKLLAIELAAEYPKEFAEVLNYLTVLLKCYKSHNNVLASIVLCLAEVCTNLRAHSLACLPNFMPPLLKLLRLQKTGEVSPLLLLSLVTAVQKIVTTLPLFLSSYLEKLLCEVSLLSSSWNGEKCKIALKLSDVRCKIGANIPTRVLIPKIEESYEKLIEKSYYCGIPYLMDVLVQNLKCLPGAEITANLPLLKSFFIKALQFRADGKTSEQEVADVEAHIVQALTKLILKLNETSFRPLYYQLFDWAVRSEEKSERVITFYALSSAIAESLKGLFVLFAGHFLSNAAKLLDACNVIKADDLYFEDQSKTNLLLENILKTLLSVFTYDDQKFLNKERFELLMQPLVDQLENTLGGTESLVKRNNELVTPCLVQFAVATADDALWKHLNYQILLKTRHSSPDIRLIALHCLSGVVSKLGEDFLPLLPETIPFLAELLEDEEEKVEEACRKAVQDMEKVLGENLQKYF